MTAWIFLVLAAANSCLGNLCLKYSRTAVPTDALWFQKFLSPWFIGGMFFYVVNVAFFSKALDTLNVSVAYPVLSAVGFVFLAVAAYLVLGEKLSWLQYAGIATILVGIALLACKG